MSEAQRYAVHVESLARSERRCVRRATTDLATPIRETTSAHHANIHVSPVRGNVTDTMAP